jgi:hypothetical protein
MKRLLATRRSQRRCGYTQRWQVETVNSMIKRNLGSALAAKTPGGRQRDLRLKVLVHNALSCGGSGVGTEHLRSGCCANHTTTQRPPSGCNAVGDSRMRYPS